MLFVNNKVHDVRVHESRALIYCRLSFHIRKNFLQEALIIGVRVKGRKYPIVTETASWQVVCWENLRVHELNLISQLKNFWGKSRSFCKLHSPAVNYLILGRNLSNSTLCHPQWDSGKTKIVTLNFYLKGETSPARFKMTTVAWHKT